MIPLFPAAKFLIEGRSNAAKKIGLPEMLKQYQKAGRQEGRRKPKRPTEAVTAGKPKRTRIRKKKA